VQVLTQCGRRPRYSLLDPTDEITPSTVRSSRPSDQKTPEPSPVPLELPSFAISLLWHASFDHDPGHSWLRQTLNALVSEDSLEL